MKSYVIKSLDLIDLVGRCKDDEKLYLLAGRRPKLSFSPSSSLTLYPNDINIQEIKDFCQTADSQKNLVIGFFSYDLGLYTHELTPENKTKLPLAQLYSFENWIEAKEDYLLIKYRDDNFLNAVKLIAERPKKNIGPLKTKKGFRPCWDIDRYKFSFDKVKEYIRSGDIYQINLSYPLSAVSDNSPKDVFIQTQKANQAAMAGLFQSEEFDLISLSPETFINIDKDFIETFPIKGTRARRTDVSDEKIEGELVKDKKERAELNMISDLLRNDLSMVCTPGSVKMKSRQNTARLSQVIHTYSHITGELRSDVQPIEALINVFPGGSISGCPKKRALEIIDEVEEYAREPYTGSLFAIEPGGKLEANILIRTLVKKKDKITLQVGGGIVFDSKYQDEYQETLDKALSITKVFDQKVT